MSWLDFFAGAADGASQGLGNVNRLQQQTFERDQSLVDMQLRQKALAQQQEQQKRQAVLEARQLLKPGMKVQPDQFQQFAEQGFHTGIEKDPTTGEMVVGMGSVEQQQLANAKTAYESAITDLADKKGQQAAMQAIRAQGARFFEQPLNTRLAQGISAGLPQGDMVTPGEELQNSATLAAAQARAYASSIPRPQTEYQDSTLQMRAMEAATKDANAEIRQRYPVGTVVPPGLQQQLYQQHLQKYLGPAAGGSPTGQMQQIGKYQVQY
jgi:hypothetical protein